MILTTFEDVEKNRRRWTLEVDNLDLSALRLSPGDRRLMAFCERSDSVAMKLLALALLARRVEDSRRA